MPMDLILDSLDSVEDEKVKALYKENNGKFALDLDAYAEFVKAPVVAKNKDYQKRLEKVKPVADKFKDVTDDDWTAYQEWKAEQAERDDDDGDGKDDEKDKGKGKKPDAVDVKKIVKEELRKQAAAHQAALAEKDKAIEAEKSRFETYRFEEELADAALEAGVIGARLKKFKLAAINEGVFAYKDGKLVALDEDGEPTSEKPGEKLSKMATSDEWKFFFEAKEAGGGSGTRKGAATQGSKELKRSKMSAREKSDYIKEHGKSAFLQLPM